MKLYGFSASPRTWKVRAVAAHLGIPLEYQQLDAFKGENRTPQYLALNPAGRTPTLVDGDFVLWESDAILQYLASKTPNTLWPDDPRTRADIMRWQNWQSAHWGSDACVPLTFQNLVKGIFGLGAPDAAVVSRRRRPSTRRRPSSTSISPSASGLWAPALRSRTSPSARICSTPTRPSCRLPPTRTLPAGSSGCRRCPAGRRPLRRRARPLRPDPQGGASCSIRSFHNRNGCAHARRFFSRRRSSPGHAMN